MATAPTRPNYMLIWLYLFVLTVIEVGAAFLSHIPKHWLILILLFLAVWKALLVAMYFMHLKFERWRLRMVFIVPLPLAAILVLATITEKIW
jgi:cytochrome c oxidase subunit IV